MKKAEIAEREKSLQRQVLQVEDPVWVWTIKYRRVAAFLRGYPLFLCSKTDQNGGSKRGHNTRNDTYVRENGGYCSHPVTAHLLRSYRWAKYL